MDKSAPDLPDLRDLRSRPGAIRLRPPPGPGRAVPALHPASEPFARHRLDVGDGHDLYVEECGRPDGRPVLVLHGGPGGGCSPMMRQFFDPAVFRAVLFDQRGCGRSRPHAAVEANTTWHLVADIERIREHLGIESWACVFGGSWGATLALLYAQAHPARVEAMALRGVFLMTEPELDWFYRGGAGAFYPDLWARFLAPLTEADRADPVAAYHRRIHQDGGDALALARTWAAWENALATLDGAGRWHEAPADFARAFARIETHYFAHGGFLAADQAILRNMDRIAHIPAVIAQGRQDMICPPRAAWELAQRWPAARLDLVSHAGHALSEPGLSATLVRAMDALGRRDWGPGAAPTGERA